jgi:hypothetical protein
MTMRRRGAAPEADDLAHVQFIDDAERAESAWLIARDSYPAARAPSLQIESDYAEIEGMLGNLAPYASDERWHDEVLRAAAPPRRWWHGGGSRRAAGAAFIMAAAVAVLVLIPRPPAAELEIEIRHADPTRSDSREAAVGDQLAITARPRGAGDLRVFRSDGTPVARCPDGPACKVATHGEYIIEFTFDAPGQYQVILVVGMNAALPDTMMNAYLDAAGTAKARIVTYPPIDVH